MSPNSQSKKYLREPTHEAIHGFMFCVFRESTHGPKNGSHKSTHKGKYGFMSPNSKSKKWLREPTHEAKNVFMFCAFRESTHKPKNGSQK